ncbi:MAG TPA: hypothetical protein VK900_21760 [Anaerolineales bacterium]|nr:hypothetical protein [Anaerolineales bacterium]
MITLFVCAGLVMGTLGCSFSISSPSSPSEADQVATVVAATMQAFTVVPAVDIPIQAATERSGNIVSLENVSFVVPGGLADSASSDRMTAVASNSTAPWDIAPTHLRFTLTDYALQDKFHEPRIYMYPADDYALSNPGAAEQIDRLRRILAGSPQMRETLPAVPFFNATPLIAANIQLLSFRSGRGVRALTQYAQYAAPVNNHELFYHFQGLTDDGRYYIVAVLPVTAPILADDEKIEAPVPDGGVAIPANIGPNDVYYISVTQRLNALARDSYTPALNDVDALVQSIQVTDP